MRHVLALSLALLFCLAGAAYALLVAQVTLKNYGAITAVGIGVYQDEGLTRPLKSIDWGTLEPGASAAFVAYIQSNSTVPITLNATTKNWDPPQAATYMRLTWDREGQRLDPGQAVAATFTLAVSPDVTGITAFKFDIIVTVTQLGTVAPVPENR